ncbi:uroplakin 1B [Cricetulus griseus]
MDEPPQEAPNGSLDNKDTAQSPNNQKTYIEEGAGQDPHTGSENTGVGSSEQTSDKASSQTANEGSGWTDPRTSEEASQPSEHRGTSQQIDRRSSGQTERKTSETYNQQLPSLFEGKAYEKTDDRASLPFGGKAFEQTDQGTWEFGDQTSSDQADYRTSGRSQYQVYNEVDYLPEDFSGQHRFSGDQERDYRDYVRMKRDAQMADYRSYYKTLAQTENRSLSEIVDNKEVREADFKIQPCTFEVSQTDLRSKVSASWETESAATVQGYKPPEAEFTTDTQSSYGKLPSITTKVYYSSSQEKAQTTELPTVVAVPYEHYFIIYCPWEYNLWLQKLNLALILCNLWETLKMAKDDSTVRCFQGLLIFGHVIVGCSALGHQPDRSTRDLFQMCGIALTAECIFFVSDQHSLYPLLEATNNDDIYGAAWIGMFVGICLFCLSVLAIVGILKSNRKILLAFTANLFLKQMLVRYQNNSPPTNDDEWKNNGVTKTWDRLMLQEHCCGVNGPSDWQKYTSAFRVENNDADYPWPRQCCVMNKLKEPLNLDACKLGVPGYYHNQVITPLKTWQEMLLLFLKKMIVSCEYCGKGVYTFPLHLMLSVFSVSAHLESLQF